MANVNVGKKLLAFGNKIIFVLIILCLAVELVGASIKINEIMYDPTCSYDKYCEWVELYNDNETSIDISGWSFSDDDENDILEAYDGMIIPGYGYALIVDDDTRIYHEYEIDENVVWLYTGDDTLGNKLSENETVTIYDDNMDIIDSVSYENVDGGKTWALIDDIWQESEATPGKNNVGESRYFDYSVIEINEFLPNPEGDDDANMPDGEWVELYNDGVENLDLLGFKLKDNTGEEADIIISDSNTEDTIIKSKDYLIIYMNGKYGFLNNDGFEKIGLFDLQNNLIDEVSYSNSKEGVSWGLIEDEWRMVVPTAGKANNDDKISKSVLKIEEVYDLGSNKVAEWGDVLRIKVSIFKGDSSKNVVYLYAKKDNEKISKETKINIYEKFSNNTLTMPLQIDANCNNKFKEGRYDIILEGLDAEIERREIEIRGNDLCGKTQTAEKEKSFEYNLVDYPNIITVNNEFESVINLKNNMDEDLNVDVWGFVYRGNKKYSGDEKNNLKSVKISANSEIDVNLKNIVLDADDGEYNFKIKLLKDGRKTPYEIKKEVMLIKKEDKRENIINSITGAVVYESSQVKAKRAGIFFFAFCISILLIYYVWRKE